MPVTAHVASQFSFLLVINWIASFVIKRIKKDALGKYYYKTPPVMTTKPSSIEKAAQSGKKTAPKDIYINNLIEFFNVKKETIFNTFSGVDKTS
jgi:hypothetical protein